MAKINLNDDSFNASVVAIFNNGEAGVAENVELVEVKAKTAADNQNSPDYNLIFEDEAGNQLREGFYYLDPTNQYYDSSLKRDGKKLRHILHTYSPGINMPEFETPKEMLDLCMQKIAEIGKGQKIKLAVTYGTTNKPSSYIGVRKVVPFMALQSSQDTISFGNIDVMERVQPDSSEGGQPAAAPASTGGWS